MFTRRQDSSLRTSVSWLLILSVALLTVQPMHLHWQHVDTDDASIHRHIVDLHAAVDNIDPQHHEDATVFSLTPDGMLKKMVDNDLLIALFICLSVLLLCKTGERKPYQRSRATLPPDRCSVGPPLRAPPRS